MTVSTFFMAANIMTMLVVVICLLTISFSGALSLQQLGPSSEASPQSFVKSKEFSSGKEDYHHQNEYQIDRNFAVEIDRMVARMDHFEEQIALLKSKNHNQEKEIDILKTEMNRLNSNEEKRASINKQLEPPQQISRRKVRSTQTSDSRSSFWSKVQVNSHELGSMPYDNYRISIYGLLNNALRVPTEKQFFYAPASQLLHKSAKAEFNNVTKQHEVVFSILMWNEQLEDQVRKYTEKIVKHPVDEGKIHVLPIEKVKLSNTNHQSHSYQLKNEWVEYNYDKYLQFAIICPIFDQCSRLSDEMHSNPSQFRDLRLEFGVSSQTPLRKEIAIGFETIVGGAFVAKLMQRYSEADEVFLTAEDEQGLIEETKKNVIVALEEDETTEIDPTSEENIYAVLEKELIESRGKITFDHSINMWDSLFWNEEDYRPDKIAELLNEIYQKLSNRSMSVLSNCLKDDSEVACNFSASFIEGISITSNYPKERVEKIFQKSKGNIIWNEKEFITKPMVVAKLNIAKLYDKNSFLEAKTTIIYKRAVISSSVNIQPNYKEEETSLMLQLKSMFQDLQVSKNHTAVSNELQDFRSILDQVRERVNQIDALVTSNIKEIGKIGSTLDSMVTQLHQLRNDAKDLVPQPATSTTTKPATPTLNYSRWKSTTKNPWLW